METMSHSAKILRGKRLVLYWLLWPANQRRSPPAHRVRRRDAPRLPQTSGDPPPYPVQETATTPGDGGRRETLPLWMLQPGLPLLPADCQGGAAELELAMAALRNQRSDRYSEERNTTKSANSARAEMAYLGG